MLALTLKQPWPCCILHFSKRIENRKWKPTPFTLVKGDWFALHAGKAPAAGPARAEMVAWLDDMGRMRSPDFYPGIFDDVDPLPEGIVAVCRFGGVVTRSDSPWFFGPFGWVLEEVFALPEPVPCKGGLSLWPLPEDVHAEVRRQYGRALHSEREQREFFAS